MTVERTIEAAHGYMELGLMEEGLRELDTISEEHENALQLRLLILMRLHRWQEGLKVSEKLRRHNPGLTIGYIHGAFCLHELGHTEEARQLLLDGPHEVLSKEATYFYNLGCYDAILGNPQRSVEHLKKSFRMNAIFKEIAKHDPDLSSVREFLK